MCDLSSRFKMTEVFSRSVHVYNIISVCDLSNRFQMSGVLQAYTHLQYTVWCVNSYEVPNVQSAPGMYTTASYTVLCYVSSRFHMMGSGVPGFPQQTSSAPNILLISPTYLNMGS